MRLKIEDWYDIDQSWTKDFKPGVYVLVGPNGAGKTTLLTQIREYADRHNFTHIGYNDVADGREHGKHSMLYANDATGFATADCSSEGEELAIHFGRFLGKLGSATKQAVTAGKSLICTIDGVDSGASVDRVRDLNEFLHFLEKDNEGHEIYIFISTNQYEMTHGLTCIDPRTGKQVKFSSYDNYVEWICNYLPKEDDDDEM